MKSQAIGMREERGPPVGDLSDLQILCVTNHLSMDKSRSDLQSGMESSWNNLQKLGFGGDGFRIQFRFEWQKFTYRGSTMKNFWFSVSLELVTHP